ncbi:MAG: peptidylprolyl isomerase [Pirellulales bacterium]|nr:peptidylprolyl isomerase [Pirellulales bacterium]
MSWMTDSSGRMAPSLRGGSNSLLRFAFLNALLVIGSLLPGCQPAAEKPTTNSSRATAPTQAARHLSRRPATHPSERAAELSPIVVIHTSCGDIKVRLDRQRAPQTVANFLEYVDQGHYNGTIFHQVARDQLVLGGGFTSQLNEKPTPRRPITNEAANGLSNRRGTIAMARRREAPNSATCQFYINLVDNPQLDHRDDSVDGFGYCVFGEVLSGLEVVEQIARAEVTDTAAFDLLPVHTVLIKAVKRVR